MQGSIRSTGPELRTVFSVKVYGLLIKLKRNLMRKKPHRTNMTAIFLDTFLQTQKT